MITYKSNNVKEDIKNKILLFPWREYFFCIIYKKIRQGKIKLIYVKELSIEYIQDIKLCGKNIGRFKDPISWIIQLKKYLDLLITCWDGNTYSMAKFDIDFYLEQDKPIEKSVNDFFKQTDEKNKIILILIK